MATLNTILQDSASYLDLDNALPTSTELTTRVRFANMAVNEWADAYKFRQLKVDSISTLASFASLALLNYRQLSGPPMEWLTDGTYRSYTEITPEERFEKQTSDYYCYVLGNDAVGWSLHVNGIAVNSTLTIQYIRGASGMATLTDICEVPDPLFVTNRVISYVLQARNDERFPIMLAEGNRLLKNMIGQEMYQRPGGNNSIPKRGIAAYSIG